MSVSVSVSLSVLRVLRGLKELRVLVLRC